MGPDALDLLAPYPQNAPVTDPTPSPFSLEFSNSANNAPLIQRSQPSDNQQQQPAAALLAPNPPDRSPLANIANNIELPSYAAIHRLQNIEIERERLRFRQQVKADVDAFGFKCRTLADDHLDSSHRIQELLLASNADCHTMADFTKLGNAAFIPTTVLPAILCHPIYSRANDVIEQGRALVKAMTEAAQAIPSDNPARQQVTKVVELVAKLTAAAQDLAAKSQTFFALAMAMPLMQALKPAKQTDLVRYSRNLTNRHKVLQWDLVAKGVTAEITKAVDQTPDWTGHIQKGAQRRQAKKERDHASIPKPTYDRRGQYGRPRGRGRGRGRYRAQRRGDYSNGAGSWYGQAPNEYGPPKKPTVADVVRMIQSLNPQKSGK